MISKPDEELKTRKPDERLSDDATRQNVRERYGTIAEGQRAGCGCAPACCSPDPANERSVAEEAAIISRRLGYSAAETSAVPDGANLGLGCGNPLAIASLIPGQTVLDLGSGAGFDSFLAARAVGPSGHVIGVDMTPAMLTKARANAVKGGYANTEFRLGEIENLPVANDFVDVILSNCVINLSPDKARVFQESFRVLKPGGRLAISDIVATRPVPSELRRDVELYVACAAGAAEVAQLEADLCAAGFVKVRISPKPESRDVIAGWFPGRGVEDYFASATIEASKPQ